MEDRQMNNSITNYNGQATLLEMRADPKRFPRLKTMTREEAVYGLSKIVNQAFLYRGQASDPTNIQFISSSLVDELLDDHRYGAANISLEEIQVVVKRAVLGADMFGVSVSSLYKVIMDYVKGEGHLYQKQVDAKKKDLPVSKSPVNAMIQAYTGQFIKEHKI